MKNRRAIILFADLFTIGGIQQYNRHLCDALEKEFPGHEFTGLSLYDSKKNKGIKNWRNIRMIYCGPVNWRFARKIIFIIKAVIISVFERPAFLVCGHIDLVPMALLLKKIANIKYILLTYGTDVWSVKNGIKYRGLKNAEAIIAISRHTRNVLASNGIDEKRIICLYNTVDSSLFRIRPMDKNLKVCLGLANKKIVLTVGRMRSEERYKGHDIMLKVLHMLGENYAWIVAGGGNHLSALKKESKKLGLNNRIRFLGSVDDGTLANYYNLCDCFVMPSKGEGFGIVFLEALACGKPVVGGNRDGTREPLMDGKLGFLVDPDNVEEIARAIKSACSTKENRTDPEYLAKEVETNFGIKVFDKRVKEIFSRYLS
jgi:glycosyltransferase involved in cell wall biosynthesis